jgi:hypothetical protein
MSSRATPLLVILSIAGPDTLPLSGQTRIDDLMKIQPVFIDRFEKTPKERTVTLEMDFNSPKILDPGLASLLKGKSIQKVELYYTQFQIAESFNQPELNRDRYEELKKLCPDVFKQTFTEWRIIGQTGCRTVSEAKDFFHGFVITYIPAPDKESMFKEVSTISKVLSSDSLGHDSEYVTVEIRKKRRTLATGYFLPRSKRKLQRGIRYSKKSIWNRRPEYYTRIDTVTYKHKHRVFIPSPKAVTFIKKLSDSTIFNVLARHKNWNNISFVCDATGSMAPYTTEILVWHKLNYATRKAKYFTFFNDGDNMPDNRKVLGKTGGIYSVNAGDYEAVESTLMSTMKRGCGGDAPENNCEAILRSLSDLKDAEEIVLIADNWANVKDLALANQIKKPVHIILCGADNGMINVDYLELARRTKGTIHTMKEDIDNLSKMSDGATFKFGKKKFKIYSGKVIACN